MSGGSAGALSEMVSQKMLGRKTGKGFFLYDPPGTKSSKKASAERPINPEAVALLSRHRVAPAGGSAQLSEEVMQQRMLLRFVKECIHCAEDDILAPGSRDSNPKAAYATGDIGAVFGIGFPPFLGGPFRYCDLTGLRKVSEDMQRYADTVGPQFAPPQLLLDMAKAGKTFH